MTADRTHTPIPWLDRGRYPFAVRTFDTPDGRMRYVDEGEGRPVVMVHGNPAWSFLYRHLIRRLAPSRRCIAPDHLGFGLSDKPPGADFRPRAHADRLERLLLALDIRDATLVVQDWGGPTGLAFALRHPDRVDRLVIMNTWMWPVDGDPYYVAFSRLVGGALGRLFIRRFNMFARYVMPAVYGDRSRLTPAIHRHYLAPLPTPPAREACARLPGAILGETAWLGELWAQRDVLAEKPALIVWGMKDKAFRARELARWEALLPHAQVHRLEDIGHYVQEEAPERLSALVGAFA